LASGEKVDVKIAGNHTIIKAMNLLLPLIGIGFMAFYEYCDTSCTYLKGSFVGVDLKWLGIIYMIVLFFSVFYFKDSIVTWMGHIRNILISAAVGAEFFLIGFQVVKGTYCPFCLAFGACVFGLFGINFKSMNKGLMIVSILAGLIGFTLFFEGQTSPMFDLE